MSTPIVNGDLIQARVVCYCNAQISVNILHYAAGVITGSPSYEGLPAALDTAWQAGFKNILSANARWRGVGVRRLNPSPTIEYSSIANDGIGSVTGAVLPLEMTGICTKLTGLPNRANRGRIYLPFPAVQHSGLNGEPTTTYGTNAQTICNILFLSAIYSPTGGGTVTLTPVLKHRNSFTVVPISSFRVNGKWAAQHRRGDYGRPNILPF